ncbi:unnamed protein product [Ascophyllum nodosum]
MCIFCERAKAFLDDPFAGLDFADQTVEPTSSRRYDMATKRANRTAGGPTLQDKREAERCEELRRRTRLPVTVITGFLGSGKTTFINYLLSAGHGRRLAVIENEFGEVAVDDALLENGGVQRPKEAQQVILMPNGCMCCRVRGDLVDALKRLIITSSSSGSSAPPLSGSVDVPSDGAKDRSTTFEPKPSGQKASEQQQHWAEAGALGTSSPDPRTEVKFDGVILECSGLDELAPILQTFFADPFVQEHVRLDAVVCLCDSPRLLRALVAPPPPPKNLESKVEGRAESSGDREMEISWRDTEEVDIKSSTALVMSQLALSDRVLLNKTDLITREEGDALETTVKERFPSASIRRCERGEVDINYVLGVDSFSLDKALEMDQHFAEMLADRPAEMDKKDNREDGGRHLHNVKRHGEDGVSARQHGHDRMGAQSVGMELDAGPIDWAKFKSWLKNFLEREGELIWRLKGVLWTSAPGQSGGAAGTWSLGAGKRTVVQGLYGHFESQIFEWPTGVPRRSRLVFIGNLPPRTQEALRAGVSSCIAPPRSRRSPPPPRRLAQEAAGGGSAFAARLRSVKFGGGDDDLFV